MYKSYYLITYFLHTLFCKVDFYVYFFYDIFVDALHEMSDMIECIICGLHFCHLNFCYNIISLTLTSHKFINTYMCHGVTGVMPYMLVKITFAFCLYRLQVLHHLTTHFLDIIDYDNYCIYRMDINFTKYHQTNFKKTLHYYPI